MKEISSNNRSVNKRKIFKKTPFLLFLIPSVLTIYNLQYQHLNTKSTTMASLIQPEVPSHLKAPQMHGTCFDGVKNLTPPKQILHCKLTARPGYATVDSSEYLDTPGRCKNCPFNPNTAAIDTY